MYTLFSYYGRVVPSLAITRPNSYHLMCFIVSTVIETHHWVHSLYHGSCVALIRNNAFAIYCDIATNVESRLKCMYSQLLPWAIERLCRLFI